MQKGKNLNEINGLREFQKLNLKQVIREKDSVNMCFNIANYIDKQRKNYKELTLIEKEQILLVGQLPISLHDIYDEMIAEKKDIYELLRYMILENFTQEGIINYKELKRDIINVYGFEKIFLLNNLERIKWLKEKSTSVFSKIKTGYYNNMVNKFQLISEHFTFNKIEDCSYTLGGFCPFTLKLIESFINGGWKNINEGLKSLNVFYQYPQNENELIKKEKNIVFIFFIGGVTYTEIAGIRFLNMIHKDLKFIIVTTNILNQKNTISQFDNNLNITFSIKKFYQDYEKEKNKK